MIITELTKKMSSENFSEFSVLSPLLLLPIPIQPIQGLATFQIFTPPLFIFFLILQFLN